MDAKNTQNQKIERSSSGDVAQLTRLDNLPREAIETFLAYLHAPTVTEAAEKLGITRQALWLRIKKYHLDELFAEFPKEALVRLHVYSTKAADTLGKKLDDRREALQAATEILDRVGIAGGKTNSVNISGEKVVAILGGITNNVQSNNLSKEEIDYAEGSIQTETNK